MKNEKGFTLLELVVAFSIFSILILVIYGTFFTELKRNLERSTWIAMNIEAQISMNAIIKCVDQGGNITLNGETVLSNGIKIIDASDDGVLSGSQYNLDFSQNTLIDGAGEKVSENIKRIEFVAGPAQYENIGITSGVMMIIIDMESSDVRYTLKGAINVEK